jgi:hypothetical protein
MLLFSLFVWAKRTIDKYYFEEILKSKLSFEELLENVPQTRSTLRVVDCYQQLQQYDIAEKLFRLG